MADNNVVVANGFDIIGDIHGYVEPLKKLLTELGYSILNGVWSHPDRKAIFVGDLVDRGHGQRELCNIVESMVEAGFAEMCIGNHELNAIGYSTLAENGRYLRKHSEKNNKQHQSFIDEYPLGSKAHQEVISWFKTLPLWLELKLPSGQSSRVIHAYWDQKRIDRLKPYLMKTEQGFVLGEAFDHRLFQKGEEAFELVEFILKGPEMDLPKGGSYLDKGGIRRYQSRVKWWEKGRTWIEACLFGGAQLEGFDPNEEIGQLSFEIYQDMIPVFFGHYWMSGDLRVQTPTVACLDWSIAKGGRLVAYRWDGESELKVDKMVAVSA